MDFFKIAASIQLKLRNKYELLINSAILIFHKKCRLIQLLTGVFSTDFCKARCEPTGVRFLGGCFAAPACCASPLDHVTEHIVILF